MGTFLEVSDLTPFVTLDETKALAMIEDAEALAQLVAPCISDCDFTQHSAVRAILRTALIRWNESGSGALQAQTAGPFGQTLDTRQERRGMFFSTEIVALQTICANVSGQGNVYTTSLAGPDRGTGYWAQPNLWVPI